MADCLRQVLEASGIGLDAPTVLVTEVAVALGRADALAASDGERALAGARREMLRVGWLGAEAAECPGPGDLDDQWLMSQLDQSPEDVRSRAGSASVDDLERERKFLDTVLVRFLRLKRALESLLDELDRVDHYAILGVAKSASDKELKTAYRRACLRLHPDKGGDKSHFQQLQDAYGKILEERARNSQAAPQKSGTDPAPPARHGKSSGANLSAPTAALEAGPLESAMPPAAAGVAASLASLQDALGKAIEMTTEAGKLGARVQQLKNASSDLMAALDEALVSGERLLELSEELGLCGPGLTAAAMEVAEGCLDLSAQFSMVPAAILLTDIALSCTFEASRMQHSAAQLKEVRRDTVHSLQTLRTNLSISRIVGTIDRETFRLSLGLVGKAAGRILASVQQLGAAVRDAGQRGNQCAAQAAAVVAFAEGRRAADEAAAPEQANAALPASAGWTPGDLDDAWGADAATTARDTPKPKPAAAGAPSCGDGGAGPRAAAVEARLQNDRLLRQLNAEVGKLQRRGRPHAALLLGSGSAEAAQEARDAAMYLVADALVAAAEMVEADVTSAAAADDAALASVLEAAIPSRCCLLGIAGSGLAAPLDVGAQLFRIAVLFDVKAALDAVDHQLRARLAALAGVGLRSQDAVSRAVNALLESAKECHVVA